jgi:hypothetical protein
MSFFYWIMHNHMTVDLCVLQWQPYNTMLWYKWVIRIRKSAKDRQHNSQTMIYKTLHRKLKIEWSEPPLKRGLTHWQWGLVRNQTLVDPIFQNLRFLSIFPWLLLTRKPPNKGFLLVELKSSLPKYYVTTEYLCHKWPRICSTCRKHSPVLSLFMTYHLERTWN